jgi:CPA2 family monovalent cation:H+ antiporter-2
MKGSPGIEILGEVGIVLFAALLGGLVARTLRLPVLIGYIVAGLIVGPNTPGFIANQETVRIVADVGVALLMFAVGTQFSLEELNHVRKTALVGGGIQIAGTIVLGVLLGLVFGWGLYGGLFVGCALALSSTAVMLKILEERGELGTAHGMVMLGILVVQDLSLILMIVLLPALAQVGTAGASALQGVGVALFKALVFIGATVLLATRGVPVLLDRIARTGSRELFLMAVVCLCLLAGWSADKMGLGLALGAFLAGIVVSESGFSHEVFSQVRPLRDVFASLFFVSVGMLIDPHFLVENGIIVLAVVLTILVGKTLITMWALHMLGWQPRTTLLAGLGLAQIGEFSFVLATVGASKSLIPPEIASVILSSALITILLTPFVYGGAGWLYRRLSRVPGIAQLLHQRGAIPLDAEIHQETDPPSLGTEAERAEESGKRTRHFPAPRVVIVGGGRVGRYMSDALRIKSVPHVVVDFDTAAINRLRENGVQVVYGDGTSEAVLKIARPQKADLAVVALPEASSTEMVVRALKEMAPSIRVVARVHRGDDIPRMRAAGADSVIHAQFEAGVEVIRQGLDFLRFPDDEVDAYIEGVRQYRYREEN